MQPWCRHRFADPPIPCLSPLVPCLPNRPSNSRRGDVGMGNGDILV
ncbi:unnamed protein product [Ectocarpus sp. 12 AP-2014]